MGVVGGKQYRLPVGVGGWMYTLGIAGLTSISTAPSSYKVVHPKSQGIRELWVQSKNLGSLGLDSGTSSRVTGPAHWDPYAAI